MDYSGKLSPIMSEICDNSDGTIELRILNFELIVIIKYTKNNYIHFSSLDERM